MISHGPTVTVSTDEALRSSAARAERDRQLAAWCGLTDDEVGPFLARLALFDARTPAWEARLAAERERAALEAAVRYAEQRRAVLAAIDAKETA
jgi:hypothetical protein